MSECVVRMEMPTKDKACGMVFDFDGIWYCPVEKRICHQLENGGIPSWCPIICSLLEGHGRLGDLDAVFYSLAKQETIDGQPRAIRRARHIVEKEPTIVPAAERSET